MAPLIKTPCTIIKTVTRQRNDGILSLFIYYYQSYRIFIQALPKALITYVTPMIKIYLYTLCNYIVLEKRSLLKTIVNDRGKMFIDTARQVFRIIERETGEDLDLVI